MAFIYINRERWQKLNQLIPTPTRRSLRERALWAIDHEILLTLDDVEMSKRGQTNSVSVTSPFDHFAFRLAVTGRSIN